VTTRPVNSPSADVRPIRRWLQINVCVLCCLAGISFAAAEGRPLALISVPVAVIGLLFVDRRDHFGLPTIVANLLGFAGIFAAGVEFFSEAIEGRLLGFGHLLLYLTWILLLQRKGKAQFWWLCALSLLQMATASVLTTEAWFPLAAMLYMLLALWTLSVFSLDRAVVQSSGVVAAARRTQRGLSNGSDAAENISRSRSNVQSESAARWITPRFLLGVMLNGVVSLLVGLAMFVLIPRVWAGSFRIFSDTPAEGRQPLTGFAEEVSLGDMGEILENPNLVLDVEFFDHQTDEPLDVDVTMLQHGYDAPLFRGKVLGRYANGRWTPPSYTATTRRDHLPRDEPLIRQQIRLRSIGTQILFAAGRALVCRAEEGEGNVRIEHELLSNVFTVDAGSTGRRKTREEFRYEAYSSLSGESLRSLRPSLQIFRLHDDYQQAMLTLPTNLPRLQELAHRLVEPKEDGPRSDAERAAIIVDHLRNSNTYGYSLSVAVDDPSIDPVEDFLFNRQQGHCEYFASALALMLRSVGIPARLISGFKGGELNPVTGRFEVRQLHAHAWVEALLDGQWTVLDATPATRDESVAQISTDVSPFVQMRRYFQSWWTRGLALNQRQQERTVYRPLRRMFQDWADEVRRDGLLPAVTSWLRQLSANPEDWISLWGFVTAFVLLLLLSAIVWAVRRLWNLVRAATFGRRQDESQQRQLVEFYERFRRLVARQGHVRSDVITQREFASQIEAQWQQQPDVDGLGELPTRLADAFYQVRFGSRTLGASELQALQTSLDQLERWIQRGASQLGPSDETPSPRR